MTQYLTHMPLSSKDETDKSMADFRSTGLSIAAWARQKGFSRELVYSVLRGERKCIRGKSLLIAKALGMK